jgi:YqaJ-like viral recombinase domain
MDELIQGSPEWFALRAGKVTASRIGDLMRRTQKGWGADRKHYLAKLVAERITGKPMAQRTVLSLERRLEVEPEARSAYEFYSDNTVTEVGFIPHPRIPDCGASPDGLIGDAGGLEIKCCDTPAHIEMLTTGAIDPDYVLQCQFGMSCTERQWWDFASYDPLMPEDLKLFVRRIHRDEERIANMESQVIEFLAEVDVKVQQLVALREGSSPLAAVLEKSLASLNAPT